jgi:hypothetical protein
LGSLDRDQIEESSMELILSGAITEKSSYEEVNLLIDFLASELENTPFYRRVFQPGVIVNITFDWIAIISITSSVITIGQVLWAAYRKIIAYKKENNPSCDAKLIFELKNGDNEFVQIVLGSEFTSEEEFLPEFERRIINTFKKSKKGEISLKEIVEESVQWKRIK